MSSSEKSGGIAKVLVVGDVYTGKTSVIRRYVRNQFSKDYQTTIGVDFALKRVHTSNGDINVQLWDIAGQERFAGLSRIFYTHAVAAIIVFDITKRDSFENTIKWKDDINSKVFLPSGERIPVLLLANKIDLVTSGEEQQCCSDEELQTKVRDHSFFEVHKVSAKTGENVKKGCNRLITKISENNVSEMELQNKKQAEPPTASVSLRQDQPPADDSGCC